MEWNYVPLLALLGICAIAIALSWVAHEIEWRTDIPAPFVLLGLFVVFFGIGAGFVVPA